MAKGEPTRAQRLAKALRANLSKRKAQARAADAAAGAPETAPSAPEPRIFTPTIASKDPDKGPTSG